MVYFLTEMETRQLKINASVDAQLQAAARQFALSKKGFVEEAILFFARNNISPKGYSPCREFDQVQLIRKSTERIVGLLQQQEREVFSTLLTEILRNQVAVQALMNLVVDASVEPGRQAAVAERIQAYIREHMEQLNVPAKEALLGKND